MVSRVLQAKPNAQQSEVVRSLNARIRAAINSRIYWSDLLSKRIISIPDAYTTGTVTFNPGSTMVAGIGTGFPISDQVNTGPQAGVGLQDIGYQEITPLDMTGIAVDTLLLVDAAGRPETVAVVETTPVSFWAKFQFPHDPNFTITSSSLAGLQIYAGSNYPIFTVKSVRDASTLEIDNPWGGPQLANQTYQIYKGYTTIDPNLKVIIDIVDQQVGRRLETYVPVTAVNSTDPQRTAAQDPLALLPLFPTESGSMLYEIWPRSTTARQLYVLVGLQWPELRMENDRPPWFIDPNLFVQGAIADMLRIKNVKFGPLNPNPVDPWHDPNLAREYEAMFQFGLQQCVNSDESKAQRAYSREYNEILTAGGANYWRAHDGDLDRWRL
jgi:hypothetical protein